MIFAETIAIAYADILQWILTSDNAGHFYVDEQKHVGAAALMVAAEVRTLARLREWFDELKPVMQDSMIGDLAAGDTLELSLPDSLPHTDRSIITMSWAVRRNGAIFDYGALPIGTIQTIWPHLALAGFANRSFELSPSDIKSATISIRIRLDTARWPESSAVAHDITWCLGRAAGFRSILLEREPNQNGDRIQALRMSHAALVRKPLAEQLKMHAAASADDRAPLHVAARAILNRHGIKPVLLTSIDALRQIAARHVGIMSPSPEGLVRFELYGYKAIAFEHFPTNPRIPGILCIPRDILVVSCAMPPSWTCGSSKIRHQCILLPQIGSMQQISALV